MRMLTLAAAGSMLLGLLAGTSPAQAGVCPGTPYSGGDCNLFITFNANGSITTTGPGGNYDGSEDSLIGVINNTTHTLSSFHISSPLQIFGLMEPGPFGDGIGSLSYGHPPVGSNPDTTYYGGPNGYFTNIVGGNSGDVNFANGGIRPGGTDYFSLEFGIDLNAPPTITPAPEPATLALLGAGLFGLGFARRRKA